MAGGKFRIGGGNNPRAVGLALESYQNSAMSAAVQAYVFRDADGNITRVYEPVRNNDVSRNTFAYVDSIDKFPFDSADCFNSTLKDVKVVNIGSGLKVQGSTLETMVVAGNKSNNYPVVDIVDLNTFTISGDHTGLFAGGTPFSVSGTIGSGPNQIDGTYYIALSSSFDGTYTAILVDAIGENVATKGNITVATGAVTTGLQLINHTHKGNYGTDADNGAEIYLTGDNVVFKNNNCGNDVYFNSVGNNCNIHDNAIQTYSFVYFNNYANIQFKYNTLNSLTMVRLFSDGLQYEGNQQDAEADVFTFSTVRYSDFGCLSYCTLKASSFNGLSVGNQCNIVALDFLLDHSVFGVAITYTATADKPNTQFVKIGSTNYEVGLLDAEGTLYQTLTAV